METTLNQSKSLKSPTTKIGVARRIVHTLKVYGKSLFFQRKHGFKPPPDGTDLSTQKLLAKIIELNCFSRPGDVVEIGAFLGGGTYTLSNILLRQAPEKKLYTIDIFDPTFDVTPCLKGLSMATLYADHLAGRSQEEVFREITRRCSNLVVIKGDSKMVTLPCENVCFAYIDGNHEFSYVKSDFRLIWGKLVSGGVIALDDYAYDIPEVTLAIHELIGENSSAIKRIDTQTSRTIFIQKT